MSMIKGKRSKRSRPSSPDDGGSGVSEEWVLAKSTVTEEEHEMAQCLILLAKGPYRPIKRRVTNPNGTTSSYECKTCNRTFPSFQALGGHRTSHKKPKINTLVEEQHPKKSSVILTLLKDNSNQIQEKKPKVEQFNDVSLTLQMGNNTSAARASTSTSAGIISKAKVHDCSICGAEFSSGQALGGHMRRHRPIVTSSTAVGALTKNVLSLDLNLPAPEEENSSKFVFGLNEKTLVFTASNLVDCHY